jgi:hypothetical protein
MFGIPLATLLTLAIQYGPKAVALFEAVKPVIEAAAPAIAKMVAAGIPEEAAAKKAFGHLAGLHRMTPEEEQRWFDRQTPQL